MTKIISSCLTKPTTYRSLQTGNVAIFSTRCKIVSLRNNGCSSRCQLTSRENAAADELSAAVRSPVVSSIVPFGKTTRNKKKRKTTVKRISGGRRNRNKKQSRGRKKNRRKLFQRGKRETVEIENIGLFALRALSRSRTHRIQFPGCASSTRRGTNVPRRPT